MSRCVALHDYTATSKKELTIVAGATVHILSKTGEWWLAESNGSTGYIPPSYVQLLPDSEQMQPFKAVAIYTHEGNTDRELTFWQNEYVRVLECDDDEWWYGIIANPGNQTHNVAGYFAKAYVERVPDDEPPEVVRKREIRMATIRKMKPKLPPKPSMDTLPRPKKHAHLLKSNSASSSPKPSLPTRNSSLASNSTNAKAVEQEDDAKAQAAAELKRREEEMRQKELQLERKLQEMERKMKEMELAAFHKEQEAAQREAEAREKEEQAKRKEEQAKRREAEAKRLAAEAKRLEEEATLKAKQLQQQSDSLNAEAKQLEIAAAEEQQRLQKEQERITQQEKELAQQKQKATTAASTTTTSNTPTTTASSSASTTSESTSTTKKTKAPSKYDVQRKKKFVSGASAQRSRQKKRNKQYGVDVCGHSRKSSGNDLDSL